MGSNSSKIKYNGLCIAIYISSCHLNVQAIQLRNGQISSQIDLGSRIETIGNIPTEYDAEVLRWSNKIRSDPKSFIPDIEAMIKDYHGMERYVKRDGISMHQDTKEGVKPLEQLVSFLKKQKPLPPLKLDSHLKDFACQHVKDQGPSGKVGHEGLKGDNWVHRIHSLLQPGMVHGENIAYGKETAKEAIIELAIDDGVSKRGHRHNLFKKNFDKVGICQGDHTEWNKMVVVMYSGKADLNEKEDDMDDDTTADINVPTDKKKDIKDKSKENSEKKKKEAKKKQTEEELLKKPIESPKEKTDETKEQINALKHQINELEKGRKIARDNGISNLDDKIYNDEEKPTDSQIKAKKFVDEVLEKDKKWRKETELKKEAIEKKKQEKAKKDAELIKAEEEAAQRLKEITLEKQGYDAKITKTVAEIAPKMKPDIQHVIKDFSSSTKIIMPKDMNAKDQSKKTDDVFAKKEVEKKIPSKKIIGGPTPEQLKAAAAAAKAKSDVPEFVKEDKKDQKKIVAPSTSKVNQQSIEAAKAKVDSKRQPTSEPVQKSQESKPSQKKVVKVAKKPQDKTSEKPQAKPTSAAPKVGENQKVVAKPEDSAPKTGEKPKAVVKPKVVGKPKDVAKPKDSAPKALEKSQDKAPKAQQKPKVVAKPKQANSPAPDSKPAISPAPAKDPAVSNLDKFMKKVKNSDPSKPAVETTNKQDAEKAAKDQEKANKQNAKKKVQIKGLKDALEGKGDPKQLDKPMQPKKKEPKPEKKKEELQKADDNLEEDLKKEEEGEESVGDVKIQKRMKEHDSDKTDDEKKADKQKEEKTQKLGNQVKDILKNFDSETAREMNKKDKAKEKKKLVIKDVLGNMKTSIHEYHDQKDRINNGVDSKGQHYQDERAKAGLGDIKDTVGKYEHLKDLTVNALKEEGKILQHEQDMKAKAVLHTITPVVQQAAHSHTQHDFEKDKKENEFKDKPELTHQEKEDAIIEATKNAPKIGFSKVFEAAKDVHQSTLPKKAMMKDIMSSIKDGINQKEHQISEGISENDIMDHQNKIAHDYEDIKPEEMDSNSEESIESLLKKTSKLKALEIAMKDKEQEVEHSQNKDDSSSSHAQGPVAKASLDAPELKETKKDEKKDDKSSDKEMVAGFKSFYDPTWNPKEDNEMKDDMEKQVPGNVNENQIETDNRSPLDFHYDSTGGNKISRGEDPPQTATEFAQASGQEFDSGFENWLSNMPTYLVNNNIQTDSENTDTNQ